MRISNRTIITIGIVLIFIGLFAVCSNYFAMKKAKVYDTITLAMSELPSNIDREDENTPSNPSSDNDNDNNGDDAPTNNNSGEIITPESYYVGKLEIPIINLSRGFTSISSKYNDVNKNIAVINGSNYPDVLNGNFILAGHSGSSWRGFFHNLYKLKVNNEAYVYYNNVKYKYKLVKIYDEKKDGSVRIFRDKNKTTMTLITCTRGSNTKQTVYIFNLVEKENY